MQGSILYFLDNRSAASILIFFCLKGESFLLALSNCFRLSCCSQFLHRAPSSSCPSYFPLESSTFQNAEGVLQILKYISNTALWQEAGFYCRCFDLQLKFNFSPVGLTSLIVLYSFHLFQRRKLNCLPVVFHQSFECPHAIIKLM